MKLWYLAKPKFGGWVTFTAHLWHEIKRLQKLKPRLVTMGTQITKVKDFGYGVPMFQEKYPHHGAKHLITAVDKNFYDRLWEFPENTWIVIHDPTELKEEVLKNLPRFNVITIRKTVQDLLLTKHGIDSTFLHHPFHQYPTTHAKASEREGALSCSRIDFDKNIDLILKANAVLSESQEEIKIYGALNSMCVHFKGLKDLGFEKHYRGSFEKDFLAVETLLKNAKCLVDMSSIKNDGAGTQYTFLEAIYHGAILVLNARWFENGKDRLLPDVNCLSVKTPEELAAAVLKPYSEDMAKRAFLLLEEHGGAQWCSTLFDPK